MIRWIHLALLAAILTGNLSPAGVPAFHLIQTDNFRPSECMFDVPAGVEEGQDVACGYLTVPAYHNNPGGKSIELAVAVLKSTASSPSPIPLIIAQGGPGGSTIDTYAEILLTSHRELVQDRDVILFDQRGTLHSRPALYCDEVDTLIYETLDDDLSPEESERLYQEALTGCRKRLEARGVEVSAFNSLENAADIETLRIALGYEQINLYGVSYGSLLALHYLRRFPGSLNSVILDGVLPPQTNFILNVARTQDQAFTRLFQACRDEPGCNRSFPDLEKVFFDTVARLDQDPAVVQMTDLETSKVYPDVVINGETFLTAIFQMLYSSELVLMLPRMIYDASRGDFDVFARIYAIFVFDRSTSYGMYYSVLCAEDADFTPQEQDLTGVRPQVAAIEKETPQEFLATCEMWDAPPLDPGVDDPVTSDVPVLLLSGYFDPITPPDYAAQAAAGLSRAYNVTVPTGGHGQMLSGDCADGIIRRFLADPQSPPDTSCVNTPALPEFFTPARVVDFPLALKLLNLEPGPAIALLALLLALLFLWSAALVFPVAWLINRRARLQAASAPVEPFAAPAYSTGAYPVAESAFERPSFLSRIASWLPVVSAIVLTLFLALVVFTLAVMVNENDNRLFYGLPGEARPYFLLPVVFAILAIAMLAAAIQGWIRDTGGIWRRIYYTLLTLTALAAILLLAYLGMLTAFF